ncbi:MAG TPA: DUF2795 domain-containing protein [Gammaproteobacteria bacterium]
MARQTREREYDASDLKELMDNTAGWAKNWHDVLRYLEGPAEKDADFSKREVPQLIEDVRHLKEHRVKFMTDYREMWKELTGEDVSGLAPPRKMKQPQANPVELEDKYLRDVDFPASKSEVIHAAEKEKAPSRVLDVLHRVQSKEYREMAELLESAGDAAWDHKR